MSYSSWTVDGYGICVDDIEGVTTKKLLRLLKFAPKFKLEFLKWAEADNGEGECVEEAEITELLDYEGDCGYYGLAPIMQSVIEEAENIRLVIADDYNAVNYLLFEPFYPWSVASDEEKNATEDGIREMLGKYVRILTDKPIRITYYSVENGG